MKIIKSKTKIGFIYRVNEIRGSEGDESEKCFRLIDRLRQKGEGFIIQRFGYVKDATNKDRYMIVSIKRV